MGFLTSSPLALCILLCFQIPPKFSTSGLIVFCRWVFPLCVPTPHNFLHFFSWGWRLSVPFPAPDRTSGEVSYFAFFPTTLFPFNKLRPYVPRPIFIIFCRNFPPCTISPIFFFFLDWGRVIFRCQTIHPDSSSCDPPFLGCCSPDFFVLRHPSAGFFRVFSFPPLLAAFFKHFHPIAAIPTRLFPLHQSGQLFFRLAVPLTLFFPEPFSYPRELCAISRIALFTSPRCCLFLHCFLTLPFWVSTFFLFCFFPFISPPLSKASVKPFFAPIPPPETPPFVFGLFFFFYFAVPPFCAQQFLF